MHSTLSSLLLLLLLLSSVITPCLAEVTRQCSGSPATILVEDFYDPAETIVVTANINNCNITVVNSSFAILRLLPNITNGSSITIRNCRCFGRGDGIAFGPIDNSTVIIDTLTHEATLSNSESLLTTLLFDRILLSGSSAWNKISIENVVSKLSFNGASFTGSGSKYVSQVHFLEPITNLAGSTLRIADLFLDVSITTATTANSHFTIQSVYFSRAVTGSSTTAAASSLITTNCTAFIRNMMTFAKNIILNVVSASEGFSDFDHLEFSNLMILMEDASTLVLSKGAMSRVGIMSIYDRFVRNRLLLIRNCSAHLPGTLRTEAPSASNNVARMNGLFLQAIVGANCSTFIEDIVVNISGSLRGAGTGSAVEARGVSIAGANSFESSQIHISRVLLHVAEATGTGSGEFYGVAFPSDVRNGGNVSVSHVQFTTSGVISVTTLVLAAVKFLQVDQIDNLRLEHIGLAATQPLVTTTGVLTVQLISATWFQSFNNFDDNSPNAVSGVQVSHLTMEIASASVATLLRRCALVFLSESISAVAFFSLSNVDVSVDFGIVGGDTANFDFLLTIESGVFDTAPGAAGVVVSNVTVRKLHMSTNPSATTGYVSASGFVIADDGRGISFNRIASAIVFDNISVRNVNITSSGRNRFRVLRLANISDSTALVLQNIDVTDNIRVGSPLRPRSTQIWILDMTGGSLGSLRDGFTVRNISVALMQGLVSDGNGCNVIGIEIGGAVGGGMSSSGLFIDGITATVAGTFTSGRAYCSVQGVVFGGAVTNIAGAVTIKNVRAVNTARSFDIFVYIHQAVSFAARIQNITGLFSISDCSIFIAPENRSSLNEVDEFVDWAVVKFAGDVVDLHSSLIITRCSTVAANIGFRAARYGALDSTAVHVVSQVAGTVMARISAPAAAPGSAPAAITFSHCSLTLANMSWSASYFSVHVVELRGAITEIRNADLVFDNLTATVNTGEPPLVRYLPEIILYVVKASNISWLDNSTVSFTRINSTLISPRGASATSRNSKPNSRSMGVRIEFIGNIRSGGIVVSDCHSRGYGEASYGWFIAPFGIFTTKGAGNFPLLHLSDLTSGSDSSLSSSSSLTAPQTAGYIFIRCATFESLENVTAIRAERLRVIISVPMSIGPGAGYFTASAIGFNYLRNVSLVAVRHSSTVISEGVHIASTGSTFSVNVFSGSSRGIQATDFVVDGCSLQLLNGNSSSGATNPVFYVPAVQGFPVIAVVSLQRVDSFARFDISNSMTIIECDVVFGAKLKVVVAWFNNLIIAAGATKLEMNWTNLLLRLSGDVVTIVPQMYVVAAVGHVAMPRYEESQQQQQQQQEQFSFNATNCTVEHSGAINATELPESNVFLIIDTGAAQGTIDTKPPTRFSFDSLAVIFHESSSLVAGDDVSPSFALVTLRVAAPVLNVTVVNSRVVVASGSRLVMMLAPTAVGNSSASSVGLLLMRGTGETQKIGITVHNSSFEVVDFISSVAQSGLLSLNAALVSLLEASVAKQNVSLLISSSRLGIGVLSSSSSSSANLTVTAAVAQLQNVSSVRSLRIANSTLQVHQFVAASTTAASVDSRFDILSTSNLNTAQHAVAELVGNRVEIVGTSQRQTKGSAVASVFHCSATSGNFSLIHNTAESNNLIETALVLVDDGTSSSSPLFISARGNRLNSPASNILLVSSSSPSSPASVSQPAMMTFWIACDNEWPRSTENKLRLLAANSSLSTPLHVDFECPLTASRSSSASASYHFKNRTTNTTSMSRSAEVNEPTSTQSVHGNNGEKTHSPTLVNNSNNSSSSNNNTNTPHKEAKTRTHSLTPNITNGDDGPKTTAANRNLNPTSSDISNVLAGTALDPDSAQMQSTSYARGAVSLVGLFSRSSSTSLSMHRMATMSRITTHCLRHILLGAANATEGEIEGNNITSLTSAVDTNSSSGNTTATGDDEDTEKPDVLSSPFQLSLDSGPPRYFRGAIVSAIALCFGSVIFLFLVVLVWHKCFKGGKAKKSLCEALLAWNYPSRWLLFFVFLAGAVVEASAAVISFDPSSITTIDVVLIVIGNLTVVVPPVVYSVKVWIGSRLQEVVPRPSPPPPVWRIVYWRLIEGDEKWDDSDAEKNPWPQQHMLLVDTVRRPAFIVVDLVVTLIVAGCGGAAAWMPLGGCLPNAVTSLVALVLHLITMLFMWPPYVGPFDRLSSTALSVISVGVGIVQVLLVTESIGDVRLVTSFAALLTAQAAVGVVMAIVMLISLFVEVWDALKEVVEEYTTADADEEEDQHEQDATKTKSKKVNHDSNSSDDDDDDENELLSEQQRKRNSSKSNSRTSRNRNPAPPAEKRRFGIAHHNAATFDYDEKDDGEEMLLRQRQTTPRRNRNNSSSAGSFFGTSPARKRAPTVLDGIKTINFADI